MVIIKNAIENIKTNKLRVLVAMIWIVLGITSVVVVSSIGNGLEAMGNKNLQDPKFREKTIRFRPDFEKNIDPSLIEAFSSDDIGKISLMSGVERVTAKYGTGESLTYGTQLENEQESLFSEIVEYNDKLKLEIEYGRLFSIEDLDRRVIVLENNAAFSLSKGNIKNLIGNPITINGEDFEVIGVLKQSKKENTEMEDLYETTKSYMPKGTIEELNNQQSFEGAITEVNILVTKGYNVDEVGDNVAQMLQENTKEDGEYEVFSNRDDQFELEHMKNTLNKFTSVLSKVSLLIGGIGIMNIMYMSVAERQREIGIRRAIGAEPKDILIQFLIETIVITIMGGILGIVMGTFASGFASERIGIEAVPTAKVYFDAVITSILIGAVFGSIPAYKAANLDPIKAIQG